MAELIRVDRNGTKYYKGVAPCDRCGGVGVYFIGVHNGQPVPSSVQNGVCFKCGGSGKVLTTWKDYTPEYMEKLTAQRERRRLKWEQEHAEEIAEREREKQRRLEEQAEQLRKQEEEARREQERKALSEWVGEIGEKITTPAIMERSAWFEAPSFSGFGTDTMHVYTFRVGNDAVVWKTSSCIEFQEGRRVTIRATVKAHEVYKDEKQTQVSRLKVIE